MAEINLEQARRVLELTLGVYSDIRGRYWAAIYDAIYNYLSGESAITAYRNTHKKEMLVAFTDAAETGWSDGFPLNQEVPAWGEEETALLTAEQNAELGYIELTWTWLSELRKAGEFDAIHEAYKHADSYSKTLDRIYNEFKVLAAGSKMLTLVGRDGQKSCPECQKYKGQRHKASWWKSHNLIPGIGSAYSCGGWQCFHVLVDDNGSLFTI